MTERSPKAKSVLGTLPAARPERIGQPRQAAAKPKPKRKAKPRAVRPGAEKLTCAHEAPPPRPLELPKGRELVATAIQATGELAQIGLTLGGQALKRALRR